MKISWLVSAQYQLDPVINPEQMKSVGPIWGSWKTWRGCATDNVVCHQQQKARELLDRAFQAVCNFHVPRSLYEPLGRPVGVKLYDGDFDREVDDIEDIVAMHLSASNSDVILLLGFDLAKPTAATDRMQQHRLTNRHGLQRAAMANHTQTQWVAIDCTDPDQNYTALANFTCDSMKNALQLLL